jgi:hypothetical protein
LSNYGLNSRLVAALERIGVTVAFDDFGALVLTDAFLAPSTVSEVAHLCTLYGAGLCVADSVLVIRRDDLAANHLNHHPYVHVV